MIHFFIDFVKGICIFFVNLICKIDLVVYDKDLTLIWLTIIFYMVILAAIMMSCSSYFFEREKGFGLTTEKKTKNETITPLF